MGGGRCYVVMLLWFVVVYDDIVVVYGYVEMWLYCCGVGDIVMWLYGCDVVLCSIMWWGGAMLS